jgi:hypothetical protein
MGNCDLQLISYPSKIQNGGNRHGTSHCDKIKSMADLYLPYHTNTMDKMQIVNLQTSVVARQYWPTTV